MSDIKNDSKTIDPVAGKTVAEIFGEIVWVMSQHKTTCDIPLKDLERVVMPPVILRQFHITYAPVPLREESRNSAPAATEHQAGAGLQPIAVDLYAFTAESKEMADGLDEPHYIPKTLAEWRSGATKTVVLSIDLRGPKQ